jgi:hypothetical protein
VRGGRARFAPAQRDLAAGKGGDDGEGEEATPWRGREATPQRGRGGSGGVREAAGRAGRGRQAERARCEEGAAPGRGAWVERREGG